MHSRIQIFFNVQLVRLVPLSLQENIGKFDLLDEMTHMTTIFYFYPSKHSTSLGLKFIKQVVKTYKNVQRRKSHEKKMS